MIFSCHWIALIFSSLLLHPVHETFCELEWNRRTQRVEAALRLDSLDEQWIAKRYANQTPPDDAASQPNGTPTAPSAWQQAFLERQLMFDATGKGAERRSGHSIKWVGRKEDGAHVWWFFEVLCEQGVPPKTLETRLLFDREKGYHHRVNLLNTTQSGRTTTPVVLSEQTPKATLPLSQ
ncbi:hypothetical protein NHH03_10980 [Stieleria sp. TO1_6]|uniref:DUF6702 family protein n=1 Tax=Stieleria tagensis TaxID=2956795 RepID=UPI00209AC686|nr:DUF6702 family protein [Stieleria tagensis]MCO8122264.1 hypothetical protein [Stieleria tagensis]